MQSVVNSLQAPNSTYSTVQNMWLFLANADHWQFYAWNSPLYLHINNVEHETENTVFQVICMTW